VQIIPSHKIILYYLAQLREMEKHGKSHTRSFLGFTTLSSVPDVHSNEPWSGWNQAMQIKNDLGIPSVDIRPALVSNCNYKFF